MICIPFYFVHQSIMLTLPAHELNNLQKYISALQTERDKPFFSSSPNFISFVLETSKLNLTYKSKPLKRLRCFLERNPTTIFFVLSLENGTKIITTDPNDYKLLMFCMKYGRLDNSTTEDDLLKPEWDKQSLESIYQTVRATDHYNCLYDLYSTNILNEINKEVATNRPVFLIEAGCGDGRCSEFIMKRITADTSRKVYAAGFDINAHNIVQAQAKFPVTQQFFIQKDFSEIDDFLQEMKPFFESVDNPIIIVVFSGVLCTRVASGSRQTLRIMQTIFRSYSPDLTIVGNHVEALVNKHLFSRTGMIISDYYKLPENMDNLGQVEITQPIYYLKPRPLQDHMLKQIVWSNRRSSTGLENNLDLAMSVNPLKDLRNFAEYYQGRLDKVEQLDLSDALVQSNELLDLSLTIRQILPKLKRVMFTKTDSWCLNLIELLTADVDFRELRFLYRTDSPNVTHLPPLSIPMARRLQLFKTTPFENIPNHEFKAEMLQHK